MFDNYRRIFAKARFGWRCRAILATPPIRLRPAPVRIVSMVSRYDVTMYLIAIKSLYRYLPGGSIVVIDDGTLRKADRALLHQHLGPIPIVGLAALDSGACPSGGCWERLLHILDLSADSYVIQLDSDTLVTAPVPEIVAAIRDNVAFTLGSGPEFHIVDLDAAAAAVVSYNPEYTQIAAELALPRLPAAFGRRYVRGSAGFAGFARGGATRANAEAFSVAMQALLQRRWTEWGTEQVASNYLVSNSPGGQVLPWPKYCCFRPDADYAAASMLHFIGSWRFQRGVYADRARRVIDELGRPDAASGGAPVVMRQTIGT